MRRWLNSIVKRCYQFPHCVYTMTSSDIFIASILPFLSLRLRGKIQPETAFNYAKSFYYSRCRISSHRFLLVLIPRLCRRRAGGKRSFLFTQKFRAAKKIRSCACGPQTQILTFLKEFPPHAIKNSSVCACASPNERHKSMRARERHRNCCI